MQCNGDAAWPLPDIDIDIDMDMDRTQQAPDGTQGKRGLEPGAWLGTALGLALALASPATRAQGARGSSKMPEV
ncbi:hypothetical protein VTL71DRAFT_12608 [Oculimacula yallundae]|uniref:Uncharacterized protein n=1 Tax=Oculimacula yallundae TaxID=86028 RepID=A0ABR4CMY7_9HELO